MFDRDKMDAVLAAVVGFFLWVIIGAICDAWVRSQRAMYSKAPEQPLTINITEHTTSNGIKRYTALLKDASSPQEAEFKEIYNSSDKSE